MWGEHTLIKSGMFRLPGKKARLADNDREAVIVDGTESPIERPKKNKASGIRAQRNTTP